MATNNFGTTSADVKAGSNFIITTHTTSHPPVSLSSFGFPDTLLADSSIRTSPTEEQLPSLDLNNTLADMNRWADQRVSIFASLDAALSRAVVEAASALSELKQQTENEARLTTMAIVNERERLQRQVEELRLERIQLQDQLIEVRREIEGEQARKLALEHEVQAVLDNAKFDRDRVQMEVNQLSRQMDAMGQQLQTFFQQRFAELWEQFSKSVSQSQREETVPTPSMEEVFGNDFNPAVLWANNAPPVKLEPVFEMPDLPVKTEPIVDNGATQIKAAVTLQQFEDAPTPKANIVPVMAAPTLAVKSETVSNVKTVEPVPIINEARLELEKIVFNESEIELDESEFLKIFQTEPANQLILAAANEESVAAVGAAGGANGSIGRNRQVQTRQRIERVFNRRNNRQPRVGSQLTKTDSYRRSKRDRQAFGELGAKLGLVSEAITPPPFDEIFFAEGFTPPPEVSNFLLKLNSGQGIGNSPLAAYKTSGGKTTDLTDAGSISLEDIFTQFPTDLPVADIDEAESINWDDPSPTIGELGPDFAQHWQTSEFSLAPPEPIKNEFGPEISATDIVPMRPLFRAAPSYTPLSDSIFGNWSGIPLMPVPRKTVSEAEQKSGIVSKIYVSNLQGLALLTIEKVLRGLPGVYQVIVTTLEKGEIGMEVRHHPELELDKVLPNLPDFRLKLVELQGNVLKFIQMR